MMRVAINEGVYTGAEDGYVVTVEIKDNAAIRHKTINFADAPDDLRVAVKAQLETDGTTVEFED